MLGGRRFDLHAADRIGLQRCTGLAAIAMMMLSAATGMVVPAGRMIVLRGVPRFGLVMRMGVRVIMFHLCHRMRSQPLD